MGITNDDVKNLNKALTWFLFLALLWFLGFGNIIGIESPVGINILQRPSGGGGGGGWTGGGGTTPSTPSTPSLRSAAIEFTIANAVNGTTYSTQGNIKVDMVGSSSPVDLSDSDDSVTVNSAPEQSTTPFREGQKVVFHVSCDADAGSVGTDHYDGWYGCVLEEGTKVYELNFDCFEKVPGGYKVDLSKGTSTGHPVQWKSATTPYWTVGKLGVYPRAAKDDFTLSAVYHGTVLCTITDGTSFDTTTTGAADAALADTDEDITIVLEGDSTNICYGLPMMTVDKDGVLEEAPAYLMMSTNMTAISNSALKEQGWKMVENSGLYSEAAFYKEIDGLVPIKGDSISMFWYMPVDSSGAASSSGFYFKLWLIDFQDPQNVRYGYPSTAIQTAYGLISEFGVDAVIFARAFSVSSGVAGSQVLSWVMTTP